MNFSRDRRGQSVVIGTVIIFGFLIAALSLYQVQVVPQQNGQVEFQHSEQVRNDLVDLRAGILQAGSTERDQYETVRLGTEYPPRLLGINPPAPAGTLRTSDRSYPINISYTNGTLIERIPTRFIEYRSGYNEIERSSTWIDSSVLYVDARDDGDGVAIIEEQELVVNDTLRIVAVQNEFQTSRTGRVSLELYLKENSESSNLTNLSDFNGPVDISIPTRLDRGYWIDSIENGSVSYEKFNSDAFETPSDERNVSSLVLQVDRFNRSTVTVNSVGVQSEPSEGAVEANVGPAGRSDQTEENSPPENTDLPGGEPVVGNPSMAFDDANDNGRFDSGEKTFSKTELYDFEDESVNLVIPQSVGKLEQQNDDIFIEARSITSEVRIRSNNGDVELRATEGEILLSETVRSQNGAVDIYGKRIDISDTEIRADNDDVTISATLSGGGELVASSSTVRSQNNNIIFESVGDMFFDDATIRSQSGLITADLGGSNTIHLSGTDVQNQNGPGAIQYTPSTVSEDPDRPIAEPQ